MDAFREKEAAAAQQGFCSALGDHITGLHIMRAFEALPQKKRSAWCHRHFVSLKAMKHAERVQEQLQACFIFCALLPVHHCAGVTNLCLLVQSCELHLPPCISSSWTLTYVAMQSHLQQMGLQLEEDADREEFSALRRALLKGMFHNAARHNSGKSGYKLYGSGQEVQLHPSSVLVATKPACVVFSEVVLTSRAYAHVATVIDAAWMPEMVPRFFANSVQS